MEGFRYLAGVVTLALDPTVCVGCGACLTVCPHQVFALAAGRATVADRDACMECGACARNCPVGAITVTPGVGCASYIIKKWIYGKDAVVECC